VKKQESSGADVCTFGKKGCNILQRFSINGKRKIPLTVLDVRYDKLLNGLC